MRLTIVFAATIFMATPALLSAGGSSAGAALAQPAAAQRPAEPSAPAASPPALGIDPLSIAIGTGAIAGVVGFNLAVLGVGSMPGGFAYAAGAVVPAQMAVAINRVYAVTTAVAGGWLGEYIYTTRTGATGNQSDRLLSVGMGAMLGVTAFTVATYAMGPVPFAGPVVLEAVPVSVMLGSRLIAAASAGAGAMTGAWLYDRSTGHETNARYALTLFSGAAAGVALANLATDGALGSIGGAISAGAVEAGSVVASAAAATTSRVAAVAGAVGGALLANRWYTSVMGGGR